MQLASSLNPDLCLSAGVMPHAATNITLQIWVKLLASGEVAALAFNRGEFAMEAKFDWETLKLPGGSARKWAARDLWSKTSLGSFTQGFTTIVQPHDVRMVVLKPSTSHVTTTDRSLPYRGDQNTASKRAARLEMVNCASTQALIMQPPTLAGGAHSLLRTDTGCLSIHNATSPGTCNHATATSCSLVLAPCDAANATMLWHWKTPGHLCTVAGNDCLDRAHIPTDFTTLHVSLYTARLSNHAWHLAPWKTTAKVQLVSNCTDAPCKHHQCVGVPTGTVVKSDDGDARAGADSS